MVFFLSACTAPVKSSNNTLVKNMSLSQIDQIELGQDQEQVINVLGNPNSKEIIEKNGKKFDRFEYFKADENLSQRAIVLLDNSSRTVQSKTFIPIDVESSNWLHYFISEKYKNLKFAYYYKPRCKSHSASSDAVAVNLEKGILINYVKADLGVLAVSWMVPEELSNLVKELQRCQTSKVLPK